MNPIQAYDSLFDTLANDKLHDGWREEISASLIEKFDPDRNGNLHAWLDALNELPGQPDQRFSIEKVVEFGSKLHSGESTDRLTKALRTFHPWRKGPLQIGGVHIDTEWRSDWKWDRLREHLTPLHERSVLDVGCGNGYHCWRMLDEGADRVLGIDPTLLFVVQFLACKHFATELPVWVLPLGIEELPANTPTFDTVFSMGVLYHRRSPLDHLIDLHKLIAPQGELVLETLVVDGAEGYSLLPQGRYAQMRNVWFLPSCETLCRWVERCGFSDVRVVDVSRTTTEEQRSTDWMQFQSLADFLDPVDPDKTIEGYPAPTRAVVVATRTR